MHRRQTGAKLLVTVIASLLVVGAGCSAVNVHRNTRYFVTEDLAGESIHLRHGDEVTFNLTVRGDRDWIAVTSDEDVARPAGSTINFFGNGEKARFIDFTLVHSGHVTLTACPSGIQACSPSVSNSISVQVDVA